MDITRVPNTSFEENYSSDLNLLIARLLASPLPPFVGNRIRTFILRKIGFQIGQGTVFWGMPRFVGKNALIKHLLIGANCRFNMQAVFDLTGFITIGNEVTFGPQVTLLTGMPKSADDAEVLPVHAPVHIGEGCWIGARAVIQPGVSVGHGSVIGTGAVVTQNIPPNSLAVGFPARVIRTLPH